MVFGGYALDLNAMILSMPRALFPAMALSVYHAGPAGLGLLFAAPGVGAMIGSFLSGFIRHLRHPGRAVLYSVIGWGVFITLFGLLTVSLPLALLFLAVAGGCDAISAICRNTIQQTITPDRLRGRLSAVASMVVVGGPYLGDVRAGILAPYAHRAAAAAGQEKWEEAAAIIERVLAAEKHLYPNLDWPSGRLYHSLGLEEPLYTPSYAMRTSET